jgi:hypothetical protein
VVRTDRPVEQQRRVERLPLELSLPVRNDVLKTRTPDSRAFSGLA